MKSAKAGAQGVRRRAEMEAVSVFFFRKKAYVVTACEIEHVVSED